MPLYITQPREVLKYWLHIFDYYVMHVLNAFVISQSYKCELLLMILLFIFRLRIRSRISVTVFLKVQLINCLKFIYGIQSCAVHYDLIWKCSLSQMAVNKFSLWTQEQVLIDTDMDSFTYLSLVLGYWEGNADTLLSWQHFCQILSKSVQVCWTYSKP